MRRLIALARFVLVCRLAARAEPGKAGSTEGGATWLLGRDGPDFLRDVAEDVKAKYAVNRQRVYLFGHSTGTTEGGLTHTTRTRVGARSRPASGASKAVAGDRRRATS